MSSVERSIDGRNFVVMSYARATEGTGGWDICLTVGHPSMAACPAALLF